jgi:hypothetical protein
LSFSITRAAAKPMRVNESGSLSLATFVMSSSMNEGELKVLKRFLTGRQMSETAFVEEAAIWSRELTRMRARGPGDADNALRSIESEYGINYWTLWQLRYRLASVKKISAGAYALIKAAYDHERQRQFNKLKLDIERTEAVAGPDCDAVRAAKALVDESKE